MANELEHAARLLHVLRAWYWRGGHEPDLAREDPLYPFKAGKPAVWKAVEELLTNHPYQPISSEKKL